MLAILLSFSPILCLLVCLLGLKLSAQKSGAYSFLIAAAVYLFYFHSGLVGASISMAKGCGLALFVVLIIWGAMFLYNLVKESTALEVINKNIEIIVEDKFLQFLLLSWVFSSFLQGIAGFGVPVIVVTPILIAMGFPAVETVAAVLVGHSWAISFGSMGSSIYAMGMVADTPLEEIVQNMAIFGIVAMLCTGLSVCFIYGGKGSLLKGIPYVLISTLTMGVTLYLLASLEMFSVIGLVTGLVGLITLLLANLFNQKNRTRLKLYKAELSLFQALLPYILIVCFSIGFFILNPTWSINLSYPSYETLVGDTVLAEENYVKFNIIKFPFTIIILSSIISGMLFWKKRVFLKKNLETALNATVKKCLPTTITITFLLSMAVIMMDSGMIDVLAAATVAATEALYPVASPFIGLLGAFVTGSNTNSNIIFGSFQEVAATTLGLSTAVMCAVQSIGASIGGAIGPTTVSLGATSGQLQGKEALIYRKTLAPILITCFILGILNFVII